MIAREVVHPGQASASIRAVGQHPGLGLELSAAVDVGGGEGQRLRQRPRCVTPVYTWSELQESSFAPTSSAPFATHSGSRTLARKESSGLCWQYWVLRAAVWTMTSGCSFK